MREEDFDIVLIQDSSINEEESTQYGMFAYTHPNSNYNLGYKIAQGLRSSDGYGVDVIDYGTDTTVRVSYTNPYTGRTVSLNCLIKFASPKGDGVVKLNSNKWRTISNWDQAVNYIRTKMSQVRSMAANTSI